MMFLSPSTRCNGSLLVCDLPRRKHGRHFCGRGCCCNSSEKRTSPGEGRGFESVILGHKDGGQRTVGLGDDSELQTLGRAIDGQNPTAINQTAVVGNAVFFW